MKQILTDILGPEYDEVEDSKEQMPINAYKFMLRTGWPIKRVAKKV